MTFDDRFFSREHRYSLGADTHSERFYASIPVTLGAVDYVEYYELTAERFEELIAEPTAAVEFVEACRRRECDHLLMDEPPRRRGTPT